MLRKPDLYNKAIKLRHRGFSYNEILRYVSVGRGTISRWCHSILLTEEQKERLIEKKRNTPLICKLIKQASQSRKEARIWANKKLCSISNKDKEYTLLISGILLYWAEGARFSRNSPSIEFTNTDPYMIRIVMRFFRKIVDIPESKFKIQVRIREGGDINKAESHWSKITKVPRSNFRRPEILKLSKNSKSLERYPYGICRISISSVLSYRKIIVLIEEFIKRFLKKMNDNF